MKKNYVYAFLTVAVWSTTAAITKLLLSDIPTMETILFRETTTIGVRRMKMERTTLERKQDIVPTKFGDVEVKVCTLPDGSVRVYPEYESVAKLAKEQGISFQEIINVLE